VVYLTTLLVTQDHMVLSTNGTMNNELERMRCNFRYYPGICLEGLTSQGSAIMAGVCLIKFPLY
jgi:hypothetical protein